MNPDEPKSENKVIEPAPSATVPKLEVKTDLKPEAKGENNPKVEATTKPKPEVKSEFKPGPQPVVSAEHKAAAPGMAVGNKIIFALAIIGIIAALVAAYFFGQERKAQPPVFKPVSNPFESAIFANGMVESDQPSGANLNIFPQVPGPINRLLVKEGDSVKAGTLLFTIEDSVARANVELAEASLKLASDQYDKDRAAYDIDPKSIAKNLLDIAEDTMKQAAASLKAANALLKYYSVAAPIDGVVLAVNAAVGGYVSSQGNYDTYTELFDPLVIMSGPQDFMEVRCYVDEILISRLPSKWHIQAQMQITGTDIKVPLEFVRVQPYVSPKIELSNQKQEQVDLRVLPVIFRFEKKDFPVYPGQMVDVFIGQAAKGSEP